jgi:hypothetical protein
MLVSGCVSCKSNKERKLQYKKLKQELSSKPECCIWYERNMIIYSYQSTRKEQAFI